MTMLPSTSGYIMLIHVVVDSYYCDRCKFETLKSDLPWGLTETDYPRSYSRSNA